MNILCLDDDDLLHDTVRILFKKTPRYHIIAAATWERASLILEIERPPVDIILLDLNLGAGQPSGMDLIPVIREKSPDVDVIIITGERDPELFKQAISLGATDYYHKPFGPDLPLAVERLEQKRDKEQRYLALQRQITTAYASENFIGRSPAFLKVLEEATCLNGQRTGVLIEGETGTGKELLAKYIHDLEEDPKRPFIVVNCGALPKNLVESELFGHEKGAFTGALSRQIGKFRLAHGGDLFLDEINSLELDVQAKILRAIQEKEFYPLGSNLPVKVDVRVIAAGNKKLSDLVEEEKFRADLYHRLNVMRLTLPPLKKRHEDIPLLLDHFIRQHDKGAQRRKFTDAALRHLMAYDWPGNVRELSHMVEALLLKTKGETIDVIHLPEEVFKDRIPPAVHATLKSLEEKIGPGRDLDDLKLPEIIRLTRRELAAKEIRNHGGNRTKAAAKLGITRQGLNNILRGQGAKEA